MLLIGAPVSPSAGFKAAAELGSQRRRMNGDIGDGGGGGDGDDRSREKSAGNGGKIGAEMVDTRRSDLAAAERSCSYCRMDGRTRHADA